MGVLGGMGPLATVETYRRIVASTPARRDQDHLHVVIDSNPAVPDRTAALLSGGEDPRPLLHAGAQRLVVAGAEVLCIPCNTAHAYHEWLQRRVPVPIVHMLRETASRVAALGARRVGLLATTGTVATGLYQAELQRAGLGLVTLEAPVQSRVMDAIGAIKAGDVGDGVVSALAAAALCLVSAGADHVVVGCTEISLVAGELPLPVPVVDALDVLVSSTLRLATSVPEPPELVPHVV
ncbi:cysteate racemase [Georgenia satyanarayanai]|uniref:aspartate/glutamate racemase family protein n=1 Tax=Georgenia satyanarayanai TaxID=860221 RepID=UPI001D00D038|nr:amino acid racemase [Georgenia satyanarayanai]